MTNNWNEKQIRIQNNRLRGRKEKRVCFKFDSKQKKKYLKLIFILKWRQISIKIKKKREGEKKKKTVYASKWWERDEDKIIAQCVYTYNKHDPLNYTLNWLLMQNAC